jgi:GntR family transcriptional regulator, rspAB operon transcriptional repressor
VTTQRRLSQSPLSIRSAEDHVYEALRDQIIHGLEPLSPLALNDIANSLAVSTMPVRAALRRLEAENLVITRPRRGSVVAPLRVEDVEEIYMIRCRLEGLAALRGAPLVDTAGLAKMRKELTAVNRALARKDLDAYVLHLRELEEVVWQAAGRPRLLRLIAELRRSAERYLRIAVAEGSDEVLSAKLWEKFYDAVADHDGKAAERAIAAALTWTLDWMRRTLSLEVTRAE